MTVKELIEQLSKFDPETPVIGSCTDASNYRYTVPIESVEMGNPYDDNGYSAVDGSMNENEIWSETEDGIVYVGPNVVVIDLGDC